MIYHSCSKWMYLVCLQHLACQYIRKVCKSVNIFTNMEMWCYPCHDQNKRIWRILMQSNLRISIVSIDNPLCKVNYWRSAEGKMLLFHFDWRIYTLIQKYLKNLFWLYHCVCKLADWYLLYVVTCLHFVEAIRLSRLINVRNHGVLTHGHYYTQSYLQPL